MDDCSNVSAQADEIEALSAIYDQEFVVIDEANRRFEVTIKPSTSASSDDYCVTLKVHFPTDYPTSSPPEYELSAPWLRGSTRVRFMNALNEVYADHIGESVVYETVEKIRELIAEYLDNRDAAASVDDLDSEGGEMMESYSENSSPVKPESAESQVKADIPLPEIFSGEKLSDRHSVFQPHLAKISCQEQVDMVLNKLKENKKIAAATHNILAYRIAIDEERGIFNQGCDDDGEFHASNRMLHLMQIINAKNVMVVVTRWYGGVHLGPDRFKHINNLTRIILEEHGFIREKQEGKGKHKSSKKK